ncbi:hypothetical protein Q7F20_11800 [Curtobacterium sp. A7_M15]|uniref:hypothetical protein n=1 Tax=Curtobacterium sp. A7_M15 TaxID=3065241 RepID=UPI002737F4B0|nr:hypothetical protein [Curtobacterium sp. A7_M15]MDP4334053.1 hypothetical protein [Curtobacterium sp. A7_M15]
MHERVLAVPLSRTGGHPSAERRALQRRVHRGEFVAIRPGVLARPDDLVGLRPEDRHLLLIRASSQLIRPPVELSHRSAAAVHGLPFVGAPPDKIDVTDRRRERSETTALLRVHGAARRARPNSEWHGLPPTSTLDFEGLITASLVRTLVDVAATVPLVESLPMIDAALLERRILPEMLLDEASWRGDKGRDKAAVAIEMASSLSGSPAESVCRVRFRQLGVPQPVQQHAFHRPGERTAVVDFWFPDAGVVVEVDGRGKYEDPAMLGGRSTAEAHWQEKQREDFVRSFPEVRAVVRLTWADLMDPERIRAKLRRAGITCR